MNNSKIDRWMNERNIVLEESFVTALTKYAQDYKKKMIWQVWI